MVAVTSWHASIDYVRLTAPAHEDGQYPYWVKIARDSAAEADGTATEERATIMQYHGSKFGGSFAGISDAQGMMMQASGQIAQAMAMRYRGALYSVPRLDLQVTIWLAQDDASLAERLADSVAARRTANSKMAPPRLIKSYGRGDTLYCGSRGGSGSVYMRVYDKMRESGKDAYRNAWRFEAELTGRKALPALELLRRTDYNPRQIAQSVIAYAASRLIDMPSLDGIEPMSASGLPKPLTTDESRLIWLERQVKPALDKLLAKGYNQDYLIKLLFGD